MHVACGVQEDETSVLVNFAIRIGAILFFVLLPHVVHLDDGVLHRVHPVL